ncbi:hypothetical protein [Pseudacidovorax intermedius]|uniref:Uncharacterized protein n=1 Tax=Pseudacidovorax intermedius TaxID=433924 RepID=A0A147GQX2_9BURK|nr:hypothetical protein [Pseudacidovorax intermedius]KTT17965.1 hypothetical protein NS331_16535 [Pseudacidovorax intermedius]
MAVIAPIDGRQNGKFLATGQTLTASDSLTVNPDRKQLLVLTNGTASTITATLLGSTATAADLPGYGGSVSLSAGYPIAVAANTAQAVELADIALFLQGNVTITGGTGLNAKLFEL